MSASLSFYALNRHLHSFPTRRSSDFMATRMCRPVPLVLRAVLLGALGMLLAAPRAALGQGDEYVKAHYTKYEYRIAMRSEEHTSELQSRQYLVCRLLLEKKDNIRASK